MLFSFYFFSLFSFSYIFYLSLFAFSCILVIRMQCIDVIQDFMRTREVGEFISGALAGAMTKAVLAPLETIRLAFDLFVYDFQLLHKGLSFDSEV